MDIALLKLKRNNSYSISIPCKLKLYKSCIWSLLLYGSPIWYENLCQLTNLERIQSRATRWVLGKIFSSKNRLSELNSPFSLRLQLDDLILFNKNLNYHYEMDVWRILKENLILKIDFENAFNLINRQFMLEKTFELHPDVYKYSH